MLSTVPPFFQLQKPLPGMVLGHVGFKWACRHACGAQTLASSCSAPGREGHLGGDQQHLVGALPCNVGGAFVQRSPACTVPPWSTGCGMQTHQADGCLAEHGVARQMRFPQNPPHLLSADSISIQRSSFDQAEIIDRQTL